MRVKSSLLNISAGIGNQIIITALSLISRTVFINSLGIEYLGINGLFTSILAMLTLAEAGIGASIVYNLYKPVADNNQPKILALMQLYKKAYLFIAAFIMLLGLALMPFLDLFIKDTSIEHIAFIYFLFLVNTAAPYLFVYKNSFLNVSQKNYIVTAVFSISAIISTCMKIAILYYTENFILYLAIESIISIITSITLAAIVDKMYPFLKQKLVTKLDPETKANFIKNMKAIMLQNVGNYFIFGVDGILISSFVSLSAVGLYSNYKMLIELCRTFLNQVFTNMYHSLGNLVAKESAAAIYRIFKVTFLLNFWLYSLLSIGLYLLVEPLILVWIGPEFRMANAVLLLLVLAFYERGMRNSLTAVKSTAGIFHEDRFAPMFQAALNLGISLVLVHYMGIAGIFIGTLLSALLVPFWYTPMLVYKKVFEQPVGFYYKKYLYYTFIGLAAFFFSKVAISLITSTTIIGLLIKGVICVLVVNICYTAVFFKTDEFKYLLGIAKGLLNKIPRFNPLLQKSMKRDHNIEVGGNK
ncbi:O-antigen/teichoic acid export membrane protein [Paenibacillus castaneae]|uniref:lipopolysaccharide biosynthesis protein n=1 Tax=Paenibacillus castaneae TaxID=474957 RepID=UPI000C9CA385|nr:oligosaccharide flippase family protein [Paenibacillus castaneae]NIK76086.1 O-antigen/teichoic acid export membrane protein [Paenibacillus castaneae]